MNIKPSIVNKKIIEPGSIVTIIKASAASMCLYQKLKMQGIPALHCPCSIGSSTRLVVVKQIDKGYLLKTESNNAIRTAAVSGDLRVIG